MGKFEIFLALIIMCVFALANFFINGSFSKDSIIVAVILGILSLLSYLISDEDFEKYSDY
ncbi:MAG: hypothetical protein AB6733_07520 [Clostridiaceae bacterium]